jgi:hypothetical protein
MPPPPERRWPGIVVGYGVLAGILALAGTPAYYYVEPADKPAIVRLCVAGLLGVGLLHLWRIMRARIEAQEPSAFERALRPVRPEPWWAPLFVKLRDELWHSRASQSYFEDVLWPRILMLAAGLPHDQSAAPMGMPARRRVPWRGPSLAVLRRMITALEERP